MTNKFFTNDFSRVFAIPYTAGPAHAPDYEGLWKSGAAGWPQGDITRIKIPDDDRYGSFITVGKMKGEQGNPTLNIMARYTRELSDLLALVRKGCDTDIQVHMGLCQNPQDFNGGWDKILVLTNASPTNYSTDDLGALDDTERAVVNEEVPFSGEDMFEIIKLGLQEQAKSAVVQSVIDITICDTISCGLCGIPSDGCQRVFALTLTAGGSPGLSAEVVFTDDGGATWDDTNITTLAANEDPSAEACVGIYLVVVSNASTSLHYAEINDILNGTDVWTEVGTGFVVGGKPNDIFSAGPTQTWIVGDGGYIYYTEDPTAGVTVQTAGDATVQNLNAIHGYDSLNLVAVGAANAVVLTRNGGETWASITGPAVGVVLNTVFMKSEDTWFIGTAGGKLFYTEDGGTTWVEKTFSGSGAGQVRDIVFVNNTVGYMAHSTATPAGRVFRTIDGGFSWYMLPEGTGTIPANDFVAALAVCEDPNIFFGGGLADNATDGFIVKGA